MEDIIILILNYNSEKMTTDCVSNLLKISNKINILVVDNCSTDGSYDRLKLLFSRNDDQVEIIKCDTNSGYARGNNFGMKYIREKYCEKKYVIVMNPDIIILNEKTIVGLYSFLERHKDYAIASCQAVFNNFWRMGTDYGWRRPSRHNLFWAGTFLGKLFLRNMNDNYESIKLIDNELATKVDVVSGCFFMARISDMEKVNYFDDRTFLYYEENIISKKMSDIGKNEAILLDCYFYHNHEHKDKSLIDYRKRLFDRKCFHDSKMIYINNYSNMTGFPLLLCKCVNNIDFQIKKIIFSLIASIKSR